MRRSLVLSLGALALIAVVGSSAPAAATKRRTFRVRDVIDGAQISATQAAYKIHDKQLGNGAGVQVVNLARSTDRETTYYGNARAVSHGSFTLGAPNARGISRLTGRGHDTSGTGRLRGFTSTYRYSGTFNTKTMRYHVVLVGIGSLPR